MTLTMTVLNTLNQIDTYFFNNSMELALAMISAFMVGQIWGFVKAAKEGQ